MHRDLDQLQKIYKKLSTQIFTQSTIKGTSSLVWSHSYYDTALWEKLLKNALGDESLISTARNKHVPKVYFLIPKKRLTLNTILFRSQLYQQ